MVFTTVQGQQCVDFAWDMGLAHYFSVGMPQQGDIFYDGTNWRFEVAGNSFDGPANPADPTGFYGGKYDVHWGRCDGNDSIGDYDIGHSDASGSSWSIPSQSSQSNSSSDCVLPDCVCVVTYTVDEDAQGTYCLNEDGCYQFDNTTTGDTYLLCWSGASWVHTNSTQAIELDHNVSLNPCTPVVTNIVYLIITGECPVESVSASSSSPSSSSSSSSVP